MNAFFGFAFFEFLRGYSARLCGFAVWASAFCF